MHIYELFFLGKIFILPIDMVIIGVYNNVRNKRTREYITGGM